MAGTPGGGSGTVTSNANYDMAMLVSADAYADMVGVVSDEDLDSISKEYVAACKAANSNSGNSDVAPFSSAVCVPPFVERTDFLAGNPSDDQMGAVLGRMKTKFTDIKTQANRLFTANRAKAEKVCTSMKGTLVLMESSISEFTCAFSKRNKTFCNPDRDGLGDMLVDETEKIEAPEVGIRAFGFIIGTRGMNLKSKTDTHFLLFGKPNAYRISHSIEKTYSCKLPK